jgi:hypothetical protein
MVRRRGPWTERPSRALSTHHPGVPILQVRTTHALARWRKARYAIVQCFLVGGCLPHPPLLRSVVHASRFLTVDPTEQCVERAVELDLSIEVIRPLAKGVSVGLRSNPGLGFAVVLEALPDGWCLSASRYGYQPLPATTEVMLADAERQVLEKIVTLCLPALAATEPIVKSQPSGSRAGPTSRTCRPP